VKKEIIYAVLLSFLFIGCLPKNSNKLNVVFDNVEKLEKGSPVKLHGITIGEVVAMDLFKDSVLVAINLKKGKRIPVNSKFSILSSLIGLTSINVEPAEAKIFLKHDDTAKGSYITKGLLDTFFEDSSNRQKAREAIEKIAAGLKELAEAKKDSSVNE